MIRVLLADDHKIVRQATRLYLESAGITVVGEASNGVEAVEMTRTLKPDVVVMDIHMPVLTGIEATRRIRLDNDDTRVLVLTAYNEAAYVHALLDAGADGYVLKTAELSHLLRALREVADGRQAYDDEALTAVRSASPSPLSDRELEVLRAAGRGQTNKEIGQALFISDRTVQGHLRNIYEKLDVTSRTEAVTLALQRGLMTLD